MLVVKLCVPGGDVLLVLSLVFERTLKVKIAEN